MQIVGWVQLIAGLPAGVVDSAAGEEGRLDVNCRDDREWRWKWQDICWLVGVANNLRQSPWNRDNIAEFLPQADLSCYSL